MKVFCRFNTVRQFWPYDWVPLLPAPLASWSKDDWDGTWRNGGFGLGLAWLWWRVSIHCHWNLSAREQL